MEAVALGWGQVAGNGGNFSQTGHFFGTTMSAPTVRASYGDVLGDGLAIVDADTDSDGILDLDDNCLLVPNVSQCDSDGDVFGNICDGDLSNNLETNSQDYILFRGLLGRPPGPSRPAED